MAGRLVGDEIRNVAQDQNMGFTLDVLERKSLNGFFQRCDITLCKGIIPDVVQG